MSDSFDYRKLIEDFVLGDRRLGDARGIKVAVRTGDRWSGGGVAALKSRPDSPDGSDPRGMEIPVRGGGALVVESELPIGATDRAYFQILAAVLGEFYLDADSLPNALAATLHQLAAIDETEGSDRFKSFITSALAALIGLVSERENIRTTVEQGLCLLLREQGILCPPRTALVRVVDVSPELLLALQEKPEELRRLSPDQFEAFIANRLDRMGFNVSLTGPTSMKDGGIDIIGVPKAMNVGCVVLAAQVKHHQGEQKTGREAVDRLAAWKGTPFGVGLLVTNTGFTKDAVWAAAQERNANFIRLRDFNALKRWLEDQYGEPEDWREIPDRIELAPGVVIEIPRPRLYSARGELLTDEN